MIGLAKLTDPHTIKYNLPGRVDVGGEVTAKDIMIATGSVPFVPPGIPIDGKTVRVLTQRYQALAVSVGMLTAYAKL